MSRCPSAAFALLLRQNQPLLLQGRHLRSHGRQEREEGSTDHAETPQAKHATVFLFVPHPMPYLRVLLSCERMSLIIDEAFTDFIAIVQK